MNDERHPPDGSGDGMEPEMSNVAPEPNRPWPEPEPHDEPTAPPPLPEPETPTPPPEPSVPDPFDGPLPPQAFGDAVAPTPPPPGMGPAPEVAPPAHPPGGDHRPGGQPRTGPGDTTLVLWPTRALSALVDWFGPGLIAGFFFQRGPLEVATVALTLVLIWALYNAWLAGSTGQSYGKRLAGTRLVRADDGQLLGGWLAIGRHLLHILDQIPFYLGFLWPLWDEKRQTFADKIVRSQVIHV